ncbi:CDC7 protein kinase [Exophiala aquamarina CBS 119918]|uniref:non-specific serine/threonine protein kinase n=1 Tax=Exophiala aquamarina CBS 119918 TaxID=1182545 RepID=A0A072P1R7_9EURO|nr:CDC7 protein kinase [Exophiala aquamarina CBS 119918]KEF53632.1 CDC7 protein kinase [Exophiala aquamarina CBS 119918]
MKLTKQAQGVLKALRSKQPEIPKVKSSNPPTKTSDNVSVVPANPRALSREQDQLSASAPVSPTGTRRLLSRPGEPHAQRPVAGNCTGTILGKRPRHSMGNTVIAIHEDEDATLHASAALANNTSRTMAHLESDDEGSMADSISDQSDDSEDEIDETVIEDMRKLEESFKGISQKYRLINRIGEGTFSTVYKAEQLLQRDEMDRDEENSAQDFDTEQPPKRQKTNPARLRTKPQIVALKKIYVTSSPHRILNELELLHELRDSPYICPLLTAFRHLDQVVAVLPYFRHLDFRLYYREFLINDMRHYFRSLFHALAHVHKAGILHRDIKPTNFLYDHSKRQGVLVDFGLAERQGTDWQPCLCIESREKRKDKFLSSYAVQVLQTQSDLISTGYPKSDGRPSRRANRAGTRGFRAPEVLLKCTSQTTKIDIWSAGVILLTLLARRFPFFNSADDVDAMIEMASIFGRKKMQSVAAMHGQLFETNIETIGERGFTLGKIIIWASCREKEHDALRAGEAQAVNFLEGLLELDAGKRWSAKEALQHEFFTAPVEDEEERAEREAQEMEEAERMRR